MKTGAFKDIAIGKAFICCGTSYVKKSSRTAYISAPYSGWFYFGLNERIVY